MTYGFTKSELLIVVSILAILGLSANYQFNLAGARARDYERKEQVKQVAQALRDYLADNGAYPPNSDTWGLMGCGALVDACPIEEGDGVRCAWQEGAVGTNLQCGELSYLQPVPRAPRNDEFIGTPSDRYKRLNKSEMVIESCLELKGDIEGRPIEESLTEMDEVCKSGVIYQIKNF